MPFYRTSNSACYSLKINLVSNIQGKILTFVTYNVKITPIGYLILGECCFAQEEPLYLDRTRSDYCRHCAFLRRFFYFPPNVADGVKYLHAYHVVYPFGAG